MTSHERNKRRMARLSASVRALVREGMLSADRAVRLVGWIIQAMENAS